MVAQPDQTWDETPRALVALKENSEALSEQDVIARCRDNRASVRIPETVVFGELPKTSTDNVQKFKLRDHAQKL